MWLGGSFLKRANSPPRIAARRGGGGTKKMVRSLLMDAAGVVFLVPAIGTPPRPREKRMLRDTFLIARPPLLAVMRGGEIRHFENSPQLGQQWFRSFEEGWPRRSRNITLPQNRRCRRGQTPLAKRSDLPRCAQFKVARHFV